MSNDYFNHVDFRVEDGITARGSDVNNPIDQVAQGFEKLPAELALKRGLINYAVATGSGNTYAVASPYPATAYTDGMEVTFKANHVNTGGATLNVDSLGAKSLLRSNGDPISASEIPNGKLITARYNGTSGAFEIQSSSPVLTANAEAAAVAAAADAVQTGLDRVATGADAVATAADRVATGADVVTTGNNVTAAQEARDKAEQWADAAEDAEVEAGKYSAKHWAGKASGTVAAEAVGKTGSTGSAEIPSGTQAQRDVTPSAGYFRFNSDTGKFEGYNASDWKAFVQLEDVGGSPGLPAVDGSQLTGVTTGSNVSIATITPATNADVTLTLVQYTADVLVIETGAWTTARNIIVPGESRSWQVISNSAHAATVKTAAGTGVAVEKYEPRILTCDGTNVKPVDTYADKFSGRVIAAGTATFTNSTNNIALTGVGIGVEVGDVISITGSVSNDKEFTIESITDANNVIVNAAHAGGTSSKSLVNETVAVTVTLVCKWYLAPIGLGQGWVNVAGSRVRNVTYQGAPNRVTVVAVTSHCVANTSDFYVDGLLVSRLSTSGNITSAHFISVPIGGGYLVSLGATITLWTELR